MSPEAKLFAYFIGKNLSNPLQVSPKTHWISLNLYIADFRNKILSCVYYWFFMVTWYSPIIIGLSIKAFVMANFISLNFTIRSSLKF